MGNKQIARTTKVLTLALAMAVLVEPVTMGNVLILMNVWMVLILMVVMRLLLVTTQLVETLACAPTVSLVTVTLMEPVVLILMSVQIPKLRHALGMRSVQTTTDRTLAPAQKDTLVTEQFV